MYCLYSETILSTLHSFRYSCTLYLGKYSLNCISWEELLLSVSLTSWHHVFLSFWLPLVLGLQLVCVLYVYFVPVFCNFHDSYILSVCCMFCMPVFYPEDNKTLKILLKKEPRTCMEGLSLLVSFGFYCFVFSVNSLYIYIQMERISIYTALERTHCTEPHWKPHWKSPNIDFWTPELKH